jgi:hypothetical protein
MDEYKRVLEHLPTPEFYDPDGLAAPINQDTLQQQLRRRQVFLPVLTAALETQLLAESGTFVARASNKKFYFPPCRNMERCVGMTQRFRNQSRPVIFTMILFEREYRYLCQGHGPPKVSRPCVACSRHHIAASVVFERNERMCGDAVAGDTVLPMQRDTPVIRQFYRNLVDTPGGYARKYMLVCNHSPDDPLLDPLCMPGRSMLVCKQAPEMLHEETKQPRLVVDQSAIVWTGQSTPQPVVGQNLYSFYKGASKH